MENTVQRPFYRFEETARDKFGQETENGRQLTPNQVVTYDEDDEDNNVACNSSGATPCSKTKEELEVKMENQLRWI